MRALLKSLLAVPLLLASIAVADARPLNADEKQKLEQAVQSFDTAMRARDYEVVANTIPPRILDFVAKQANIEVDALRTIVVQQMKAALATVKLEGFSMDLADLTEKELANGEPYVLIPTETVMDSEATGKMVAKSDTLALLDQGTWYLLRVNDLQQVAILRQVYPEFASVEFSGGTMEAVE
jgi:hypothetical protein